VPSKYPKLAQIRYHEPSDQNGVYIPVGNFPKSHLPSPVSHLRRDDDDNNKEDPEKKKPLSDVNDVRLTIENQRKKIISRLNSAEKMLESMDGQLFAGDEQELLLKLLQDLKRRIQTSNKKTVKSSLFQDLIIKEANVLSYLGQKRSANLLFKLAQMADPMADPTMVDPTMAGADPNAGAAAPAAFRFPGHCG
jgi:hypothetical protein